MTAYRNTRENLEARRRSLESEISELAARVGELSDLSERVQQLRAELAELSELLDQSAHRLPLIDRIRVASPCKERWDDMSGDDRVRHCARCDKNVYNLSALTAEEAELLLFEKEGKLCVRYFRRPDGTLLTSDCPVGARNKRVRRWAFAALGAGALAAASSAAVSSMTMGELEVMGGVEPIELPEPAPKPPVAPVGKLR